MDDRFKGTVIADCAGCGKPIRDRAHRDYVFTDHTYWHLECSHRSLDASGPVMNALSAVASNLNEAYGYMTDGRPGLALEAIERIIGDLGKAMSHPAVKGTCNSEEQPDDPGEVK